MRDALDPADMPMHSRRLLGQGRPARRLPGEPEPVRAAQLVAEHAEAVADLELR
jgi:hypothetical protein